MGRYGIRLYKLLRASANEDPLIVAIVLGDLLHLL
jgi:hypothetical protein